MNMVGLIIVSYKIFIYLFMLDICFIIQSFAGRSVSLIS